MIPDGAKWTETVLYAFQGGGDGGAPVGLRYNNSKNSIYGVTEYGGSRNVGTVFKIVKNGAGWSESLLHSFGTTSTDGAYPESRPIEDTNSDTLYGTTVGGGQYGYGAVWQIRQ